MFADQNEQFQKKRHLLSGLVREINETGTVPTIFERDLDTWLSDSRIPDDDDIDGKARKILMYARKKSPHYGSRIEMHLEREMPVAYAKDSEEFAALLKLLNDSGLADAKVYESDTSAGRMYADSSDVELTARGWEIAREITGRNLESLQGFVAIRFEDDSIPFIDAIEKGIGNAGYAPFCIKEKHYPEKVIDKALAEIRRSRFLITDLTKNRPAVSYEAGFAAALGIEVIFVRQKDGEKVEDFYSRHYKYLEYETPEELIGIVEEAVRARIGSQK